MMPMIINITLGIGAILTAVFSSVYEEKKDKKMIAGIVVGVVMYALGVGLLFMGNKIAGGLVAIGSILTAICSYFYNKYICDKGESASSKKKGLIAGIVIGVVMLIAGLKMPDTSSILSSVVPNSLVNNVANPSANEL